MSMFSLEKMEMCYVVISEGEIDTFTAPVLREELETVRIVEGRKIELDLSKVNYMDSTY